MLHARPDMIAGSVQTYARHFVDMAGGFASYMDRFSSKTRATLRRKRRKLMADIGGTATFREFRTPAEMDAFRDLAMPLSQRTYQARSLDAGLPAGSAAHEQRRRLAAQDRVRAFLLCRDERAVSYLYLPIDGDTVQYAYLGYDPEFARFSPGTVLQLEAMERLFAEDRYRHFDFTEGDGAHKAMFGTHSVECASLFLLRRTMAHRALLGGVDTFDAAIAHAKGRMQGSSALPRHTADAPHRLAKGPGDRPRPRSLSRVPAQDQAPSISARSILRPGPMVEVSETLRTNLPFDPVGLALTIA